MPRSQRTGRTHTTRRAHRPDGGIYRTLRLRRPGGRRRRGAGLWLAMAILIGMLIAVWLLFWR